jgi:ketosteroid isomerase-like protein
VKLFALARRLLAVTVASAGLLGLAGCATSTAVPGVDDAVAQVRAAETGFARTMADRDFAAFGSFIAEDAVFINSGQPLRGKAAILAHWKKFFDGAAAPFSWRPELVEVTTSRDLGYTEGPVMAADGKAFAKFYTTWRRDPASGRWQVAFDNGYRLCECGK